MLVINLYTFLLSFLGSLLFYLVQPLIYCVDDICSTIFSSWCLLCINKNLSLLVTRNKTQLEQDKGIKSISRFLDCGFAYNCPKLVGIFNPAFAVSAR
jgi:hypothetical protein